MNDPDEHDIHNKAAKARMRQKQILQSKFQKKRKQQQSGSSSPFNDITNTLFSPKSKLYARNQNYESIAPNISMNNTSSSLSSTPSYAKKTSPSDCNKTLPQAPKQTALKDLTNKQPAVSVTYQTPCKNPFYKPKHPFPINTPKYAASSSNPYQTNTLSPSPSIIKTPTLISTHYSQTKTSTFTQPTSSQYYSRIPKKSSTSNRLGINLLDKFRAEIDRNPMAPASTSAEQNVTNDESE
jgi:hypothetical protein